MRRHSRNGGGSNRTSTTPAIMPRPAAADGGASWTGVPDDQERGELLAALERCHGNKAEAARLLGMPRSTYYSKLKKLGLA
jgi:two-component system response regulator AtoC/two-component system response regulator HupR/HoxA